LCAVGHDTSYSLATSETARLPDGYRIDASNLKNAELVLKTEQH
jgi:hypothetical protein